VTDTRPAPPAPSRQQELYDETVGAHGAALVRLARSYEADPDRRQDLLQEIHLALWRSFAGFDGRCALRTWAYRVAHNVATSHVMRDRRDRARTLVSLEALDAVASAGDAEHDADVQLRREGLARLLARLTPLDRQLMLLYLEGLDASAIGEVTGLSPANVATKVHRIKLILARQVREGAHHAH
jgi:RNA polymerase sigma-70 factor, ECF subfamily